MDFVVDLDPTHLVLRITMTTALTDEATKNIYQAVKRLASKGGPYAAVIADLSRVVDFPVSSDTVRALAANRPAAPGTGPRVMVAREPALYGLARMFELYLVLALAVFLSMIGGILTRNRAAYQYRPNRCASFPTEQNSQPTCSAQASET